MLLRVVVFITYCSLCNCLTNNIEQGVIVFLIKIVETYPRFFGFAQPIIFWYFCLLRDVTIRQPDFCSLRGS